MSKRFWRSPIPPKLHLITLNNLPVFEQLKIEEALLRTDKRSFCLINMGSPKAIVMGISGKAEEHIDLAKTKADRIPVIRRFSGGGTVVIDEKTLLITFILSKKDLSIEAFPEPIHRWAEQLYKKAWQIPGFHFRENDYAIGDRKCGGNAQYIQKGRWLHHTSFLWDFEEMNMEYLLFPKKRPSYRLDRLHREFLCRLKEIAASPQDLISRLKKELVKRFYIEDFFMGSQLEASHRKSTELLEI